MRRLLDSLLHAAEARPRAAVLVGVVVMLLGLASALTLRPGTAVEDMLPAASPSAEALGRVLQDFRLIDDLVLVVDPPAGREGEDVSAATRRLADRLGARLAGAEGIGGVRASTGEADGTGIAATAKLHAYAAANAPWLLDDAGRERLRAALEPAAMRGSLERLHRSLGAAGSESAGGAGPTAADPLGLVATLLHPGDNPLAAPPGGEPAAAAPPSIRIAATRPANDLPYAASLLRTVNAAVAAENGDGLRTTATGAHAIADFTARSVRFDMVVSLLVTMVSLSLLFLLVYRSGRTLPLLLLTVNGGLVLAFGIYAAVGGSLSPVTAVCGAVLAGLGIDYGVHLLAARRFERGETLPLVGERAADASEKQPSRSGVSGIAPTLIAACVTSCFGFAAVGLAGVRALSEFAVLGVLGLIATLAMTLFFLPAALKLAGGSDAARPRLDPQPLLRRLLRRPRVPLFAVSIGGGMVAAVLFTGGGVRFASDLEAMHARPNPPLEAQARLTGAPDAAGGLLVLVEADPLQPGSLRERTLAAEAALTGLENEADSPVARVIGPGRFLPIGDAGAAYAGLDAAAALADFDAAAAATGFAPDAFAGFRETLAELLTPGPPPAFDALDGTPLARLLPRASAADTVPAALVVVRLARPWELLADRAGALDRVRAALAPVRGATATGLAVVGSDMQARIAEVLPRLLSIAGLAVVFWLAVVFRNPWDVFLALGPAAFGLAAVLAVVVLTDTELQAANLIALPLTLGLGVDDGIFLVHLARRVRRESTTPTAGVTAETLEAAAAGPVHAVLITSVTTIAAFGSLWFTRSPAIASLGLLSAVGVSACLAVSVFGLLPALAIQQRWLVNRREAREKRSAGGSGR